MMAVKLIFSEYPPDYKTYYFPYKVWVLQEECDSVDDMLARGFIPSRMKIGLWYLARSSRVDISQFALHSENRRVLKNTSAYHFKIQSTSTFQLNNEDLAWLGLFAQERFGGDLTNVQHTIKRMFSEHMSDIVFLWHKKEDPTIGGLVPVKVTDKSLFYWLGFYKSNFFASGLGSRMMYEAIQWSQQNNLQHAYMGTIYTESSKYKTNFKGFEYFNGFTWSNNLEELKYIISRDINDEELMKDDYFRKTFYNADKLHSFLNEIKK